MTSEWYTAAMLAGLPGLPTSAFRVRERAKKEQWISRQAEGSSVGPRSLVYHISSLPAETQAALRAREAEQLQSEAAQAGKLAAAELDLADRLHEGSSQAKRQESVRMLQGLPDKAQRRADAKLYVLKAFESSINPQIGVNASLYEFAKAYNERANAMPEWVLQALPAISVTSVQRWRRDIREEGLTKLAGNYGNRRGAGKIDSQPEVREFIVSLLVAKPHTRPSHVMQALRARYGDADGVELPSSRSLQRWIENWKAENRQTFTAISNPDEWKNKHMVAFGSMSEGVERLNQLWEMDSTPADVMLTDGRHSIVGVIDVYSRRVQLLVTKTSKAISVATTLRHALLEWGVPEIVKTDNGADYTSRHVQRVLAALDIEQKLCPPFQPWQKPHIERFFGSFTRDLVEYLDGYIGHDVAERKALEARKSFADRLMKRGEVVEITMSATEFQKFCDDWCKTIYEHRPHDGLNGLTPFQMAANWRQPITRITDERALDILLAEAPDRGGMRTVQKSGIALDNAWFIAPELEAYVGEQVQVRFDPTDLGRIYVFGGPDLQFICIAECPERTGINRQEVAAKAREMQKARVQAERAALKAAARKHKTDEVVDEILRSNAQKAGKLAILPAPAQTHDSAGLRAAADAVAAISEPTQDTSSLMGRDEFLRRRAEIVEAAQPVVPQFNTPWDRAYWTITQSFNRPLTEDETRFLNDFRRANRDGYQSAVELAEARRDRKGVNTEAKK